MYFETGGFPQNLCIILCAEALIWFLYACLFLWANQSTSSINAINLTRAEFKEM